MIFNITGMHQSSRAHANQCAFNETDNAKMGIYDAVPTNYNRSRIVTEALKEWLLDNNVPEKDLHEQMMERNQVPFPFKMSSWLATQSAHSSRLSTHSFDFVYRMIGGRGRRIR